MVNKWVEFVKDYAKENNLSYYCSMCEIKQKGLYDKEKGKQKINKRVLSFQDKMTDLNNEFKEEVRQIKKPRGVLKKDFEREKYKLVDELSKVYIQRALPIFKRVFESYRNMKDKTGYEINTMEEDPLYDLLNKHFMNHLDFSRGQALDHFNILKEFKGLGIQKTDKPVKKANKKSGNQWIEFVKEYAKRNNIPYRQAMKEARAEYNK